MSLFLPWVYSLQYFFILPKFTFHLSGKKFRVWVTFCPRFDMCHILAKNLFSPDMIFKNRVLSGRIWGTFNDFFHWKGDTFGRHFPHSLELSFFFQEFCWGKKKKTYTNKNRHKINKNYKKQTNTLSHYKILKRLISLLHPDSPFRRKYAFWFLG